MPACIYVLHRRLAWQPFADYVTRIPASIFRMRVRAYFRAVVVMYAEILVTGFPSCCSMDWRSANRRGDICMGT